MNLKIEKFYFWFIKMCFILIINVYDWPECEKMFTVERKSLKGKDR